MDLHLYQSFTSRTTAKETTASTRAPVSTVSEDRKRATIKSVTLGTLVFSFVSGELEGTGNQGGNGHRNAFLGSVTYK